MSGALSPSLRLATQAPALLAPAAARSAVCCCFSCCLSDAALACPFALKFVSLAPDRDVASKMFKHSGRRSRATRFHVAGGLRGSGARCSSGPWRLPVRGRQLPKRCLPLRLRLCLCRWAAAIYCFPSTTSRSGRFRTNRMRRGVQLRRWLRSRLSGRCWCAAPGSTPLKICRQRVGRPC